MSVLLLLNELTCPSPVSKERVNEAMDILVGLLRSIKRWRKDAVLVSDINLKELELAPGYYIQAWIGGAPRNRDMWRLIQGMRNRAPLNSVLPLGAAAGVEYVWEGQVAKALGAAHLLDGLLVSLLVDLRWNFPIVSATRTYLDEESGEDDLRSESVEVRHAATIEHATTHEDWIKRAGLPDLRGGGDIWAAQEDLYPNLQFLPRVEDDLHTLKPEWVKPVVNELRHLDDALARWDPAQRPVPTWAHVTREHEGRKLLCWFIDLDGQERLFDWHARFTPGEGRIHLRLVPEERKATIARIGLKPGT